MAKKNIYKLLATGSAKQRAIILVAHFTLKEAVEKGDEEKGKSLLTDAEEKALLSSFITPKDIKIYNDYRDLNIEILRQSKWLTILFKNLETEYWKYRYKFLEARFIHKEKVDEDYYRAIEDLLVYNYSEVIEYYTALKIYIKDSGYKDRFIIRDIDYLYKVLKNGYFDYSIEIDGKELAQNLSEIEPDEAEVRRILEQEFNYTYEPEEE